MPIGYKKPNPPFFHMQKLILGCLATLALVAACASDARAQSTINFVTNGAIVSTDSTQTGRINRFAPPSVYTSNKPFPGLFSTTPGYHYDAYIFVNTNSFDEAVFITLSSTATTSVPFSEAYLTAFDPTNLATNYRGDAGNSPVSADGVTPASTPYSILVPANTTFVVVVNEATLNGGVASYTLSVSTSVPEPSTWALLGLGAVGAGVAVWRRRRAVA